METPATESAATAAHTPSPYLTPIAVIVGAAIIAFAVMYGNPTKEPVDDAAAQAAAALEAMSPLSREDHIRGNPDAPVKIVEYSDTECPFCKQFHTTLRRIMNEYGPSGKVAWVYRHYPLDMLHQKARTEAEATECAASLGGEDAFWSYLDRLMEVTPSNDGLDTAELPRIATHVGLDADEFSACLASEKHAAVVEEHVQNAMATGGRGTPWSIIIDASGKKIAVNGAYPYANLKQIIDAALAAK